MFFSDGHKLGDIWDRRDLNDPLIRKDIKMSLADMMNGATKKIKITRTKPDRRGNYSPQEDMFEFHIPKGGFPTETTIRFPLEGDVWGYKIVASIVFTLKDEPHPIFSREGLNNLLYSHRITRKQV